MALINSRKTWSPAYADGDRAVSEPAQAVFLHHSVSVQLPDTEQIKELPAKGLTLRAREREQMRVLERIGQSRFGHGISYNVVIFPSGRAYRGVSFNRRGAHTDGRNSIVRSICFAGNYETHKPTEKQLRRAAAIIRRGRGKRWTKTAPISMHRDIKATACPGKHVAARLADIKAWSTQRTVRRTVTHRSALRETPGGKIVGYAKKGTAPHFIHGSKTLDTKGRAWIQREIDGLWQLRAKTQKRK